jgi:hypothetical protein
MKVESSTARVEKKWKIRGIRVDGGRLEFSVLAFDWSSAVKKANAKAHGGTITDIVLVD